MKSKVIYIFFILLILIKGFLFNLKYLEDEYSKEYLLMVTEAKEVSENKVSYYVKMGNDFTDKFILNIYSNKYSKEKQDITKYSFYTYGDIIKVKGKITKPKLLHNPGEFNYKLYFYSNKIHGNISTYDKAEKVEQELPIREKIFKHIYDYKSNVTNLVNNAMGDKYGALATSLIYGEKSTLNPAYEEYFKNTGTSHLMSVSGSHIAYFMCILNIVLKTNKKQNKIKHIISILLVILYVIFAGGSVSVVRAGIMVITSIVCKMFNVKNNIKTSIGVALICILLDCPFTIFNVGMQLSFVAVIGIVLFKKYISNFFNKYIKEFNIKSINKIISVVLDSIAITISVQLLILPIQISSFNEIHFPLIIPNLLIGLISVPITIIGSVGVIISFIPKISNYIFIFLKMFIIIIAKLLECLNIVSFKVSIVDIPIIVWVIYYICIFSLYITFKLKELIASRTEHKYDLKKLVKYTKVINLILVVICIILIIFFNVYSMYYSKYVYFFNVEQGDMSYIKYKNESIIVDIGSKKESLAFSVISNYFKSQNLSHVNIVIISHMHADHINGLEEFLKNFKVELVIYAKPKEETIAYTNLKKILKENNVRYKQVKSNEKIQLENITIEVLLPDNNYFKTDVVNSNSLICKIVVNRTNILYMGDAGKQAEEKLIMNKYDLSNIHILKVGHHGSKTATSNEFVKKVNPVNAVISANKKYYGHPHEQTIENLQEYGTYIYLTEKHGAIKLNVE